MIPTRLLVIEDVQSIADLVCRAAAQAGFEAQSANGSNAVTTYENFSPDAIVLDLMVPGMDEFGFLRFLKDSKSRSRIIILSGCSDAYRRQAEDFGKSAGLIIEENISKPFRIDEVRRALAKVKNSIDAVRKIA